MPSTDEGLIGLDVYLQLTSVVGHQTLNPNRIVLPTSDEDPTLHYLEQNTRRGNFSHHISHAVGKSPPQPWLLSMNVGLKEGFYVQRCGYHLHLDCLSAYLASLISESRRQ